eukprot:TRINITY_DN30_c0_g1_i1.p1 TRINITY_DN30_c0_g1~~TRINITY_DN30_c0_g1_i1.p1  ORF type:complete len:181 (+),score=31.34 TRINITY_DN30_c0_g1_i1:42-584(+)
MEMHALLLGMVVGLACAASPREQYHQALNAQFELAWTPVPQSGMLDVCIGVNGNVTRYVAIGFQADGSSGMANADIVAGLIKADGKPSVLSLYATKAVGYPDGTPTLPVTNTSVVSKFNPKGVERLHLCFTRSYHSGHVAIADGASVIYATGNVVNDGISYHGSDASTHGAAVVNWLSGR